MLPPLRCWARRRCCSSASTSPVSAGAVAVVAAEAVATVATVHAEDNDQAPRRRTFQAPPAQTGHRRPHPRPIVDPRQRHLHRQRRRSRPPTSGAIQIARHEAIDPARLRQEIVVKARTPPRRPLHRHPLRPRRRQRPRLAQRRRRPLVRMVSEVSVSRHRRPHRSTPPNPTTTTS